MLRSAVSPRLWLSLLVAVGVAWAPASAFADTSVTQTLPPGGTISTGSAVSASDPVQLQITAPNGGTFTIDKQSAPHRPPTGPGGSEDWVGPGFEVSGPMGSPVTITETMFGPDIPRPGNVRNGKTGRDASADICIFGAGFPMAECHSPAAMGDPYTTGADLPNGDVQVSRQTQVPDAQFSVDAGHVPWEVESGFGGNQDLQTVLRKGLQVGLGCTLLCYQRDTVSVSRSVARALNLRSTTIGSGSARGALAHIRLSRAFARAMRHHGRVVVTVRITITSPDTGNRTVRHAHFTLRSELG